MANKLWGGRFGKKTHPSVEAFTKSLHYDYKLAQYDIAGSILHIHILAKSGIISKAEEDKLKLALESISEKIKSGKISIAGFGDSLEDVHTLIQELLEKEAGDTALKLQTARSRNDQVVFATKLYCKMALSELRVGLSHLSGVIADLGRKNKDLIMPGFTHLQHAQPVYICDYLNVYCEMMARDIERLVHVSDSINITMGAGALAGTPILSKEYKVNAAKLLKDICGDVGNLELNATINSLDVVSDRDFVLESLSALAIIGIHTSRLSEDLILWSTKEFNFIEIDDAFCTGSSLMPQKKNPDVLELVRGYAGRLNGNLVSVLTMMKGLPLTYNRDMQLDKEPLFESIEIVLRELEVLSGLIETLTFNKNEISKHLEDESLYATDIVYYLVDKGVPFKIAHGIVGKLIKESVESGNIIKKMDEKKLKKYSDKFVKSEVIKLFDPRVSVESKKSIERRCKG